jgi:hypothetical protein
MITRVKGCLVHDDRADALAGAIFQITKQVAFDNETEMRNRKKKEIKEWLAKRKNPSANREDVSINERSKKGRLGSQFKKRGW